MSDARMRPATLRIDVHLGPGELRAALADRCPRGTLRRAQAAATEVAVRRDRLRAVRAHHPLARVLPDPTRAGDSLLGGRGNCTPLGRRYVSSRSGLAARRRRFSSSMRSRVSAASGASCRSTSRRARSGTRRSLLSSAIRRSKRTASWATSSDTCDLLPRPGRRLVAFLGSTIGNLEPRPRAAFLAQVAGLLGPDDFFLLGTDLVKDVGASRSGLRRRCRVSPLRSTSTSCPCSIASSAPTFVPQRFRHRSSLERRARVDRDAPRLERAPTASA